MALPCLFCPQPSSTKEHIIPEWIARQCPGLKGAFLGATTPDARAARKQNISVQSHRKRFFCGDCQFHFKLLEDAVIPLVRPLCCGERVTLDEAQQRLVARWAAKTAFAMIASEPKTVEAVPRWQRYALRNGDAPPDGVWVAFAAYKGLAQKDVQTHSDPHVRTPEGADRTLYSAFLSFGWVAFKVFGVEEVHPGDRWLNYGGTVQFWPPRHDVVTWPTPVGVSGRAANHFRDLIPLVGYADPVAGG